MPTPKALTPEDAATYEWQIWVPGFGKEGQEKLKGSSVTVSRCGGVGSVVAYELAASRSVVLVEAAKSEIGRRVPAHPAQEALGEPHPRIGVHELEGHQGVLSEVVADLPSPLGGLPRDWNRPGRRTVGVLDQV